MKSVLTPLVLAVGIVCGCSTHQGHPPTPIYSPPQVVRSDPRPTDGPEHARSDEHENIPLFVHLISPLYYTDPPIPPKRIVSTRISLGLDFAVSVSEPSSASSHSVGGADPFNYSGDAVLAGRIDRRGNVFWGHLLGRSHTTLNNFAGQMELEKPVASQGGAFSSAIWSVQFVLSTNWDCRSFLKE